MADDLSIKPEKLPSATNENKLPARRRLFSFSLSTFLLLATLVALALSHAIATMGLRHFREQLELQTRVNALLREELRYLDIKDMSLIHVRYVPTFEENFWRWRLYLPWRSPRRQYRIFLATQRIPAQGFDVTAESIEANQLGDSPLLLQLRVRRGTDGLLHLVTQIGNADFHSVPEYVHTLTIPDKASLLSSDIAGENKLQTAKADERLQLLRLRVNTMHAPCDGILVWVEAE